MTLNSAMARPCCGVFAQQVNRAEKVAAEISKLMNDPQPASRRALRLALERKARVENWMAAHSHVTPPPRRPALELRPLPKKPQ